MIKREIFGDYVVESVYLKERQLPPGYNRKDGQRDVNSGWRVSGGGMHGNTWIRVLALSEFDSDYLDDIHVLLGEAVAANIAVQS